ncbi:MAG: hypothetical protein AAFV37_02345 [Pseudomonadota bacterium]
MRFFITAVLIVIAAGLGWIYGSLHPAPNAILNPLKQIAAEPGPEAVTDTTSDALPSSGASLSQYRTWISDARAEHPYPESVEKMYAVMICESGGQADIVNAAGPYSGLFQYANGTWNGDWNTYRDAGILDARAQIFATALAWSLGMQSQWGCYNRAH